MFTVFTSCSLGAISIWWTSERWSFTHRRGKEWLVNTVRQLFHLSSKRKNLQRRIVTHIKRLGTQLRRVAKSLIGKDTEIRSDVESGSPKLKHPNVPTASGTKPLGTLSINLVTMEFTEPVTSREMGRPLNKSTMDPAVPIGKELWRNALRIAKMNRAMSNHGSANYQNHRQRTSSSTSSVDLKLDAIRVQSRLNALVPKLESLTPMQGKVAHRALIWNLQFSPDGKFLATSR